MLLFLFAEAILSSILPRPPLTPFGAWSVSSLNPSPKIFLHVFSNASLPISSILIPLFIVLSKQQRNKLLTSSMTLNCVALVWLSSPLRCLNSYSLVMTSSCVLHLTSGLSWEFISRMLLYDFIFDIMRPTSVLLDEHKEQMM